MTKAKLGPCMQSASNSTDRTRCESKCSCMHSSARGQWCLSMAVSGQIELYRYNCQFSAQNSGIPLLPKSEDGKPCLSLQHFMGSAGTWSNCLVAVKTWRRKGQQQKCKTFREGLLQSYQEPTNYCTYDPTASDCSRNR